MLYGIGRGDLPRLRRACTDAVAIVASQVLLRTMTHVAEIDPVSFRKDRCSRELPRLVTRTARRYVATGCLRARSMTLVTGHVGIKPCGNRESHTAQGRLMTAGAIYSLVPRVIEFHVKALEQGERFYGRLLRPHVGVADRADRAGGSGELLCVTPGARRMACARGPRRVAFAAVA